MQKIIELLFCSLTFFEFTSYNLTIYLWQTFYSHCLKKDLLLVLMYFIFLPQSILQCPCCAFALSVIYHFFYYFLFST